MILIIAGSRTITDYDILVEAINELIPEGDFFDSIVTIVSGGAKGVDTLGERYAKENKIPLKVYLAEWDRYGKGAGHIRNKKMAENADAVLVVYDGKSRGSKNMIKQAREHGLDVFIKDLSE